mmetsp:Transcript_25636/g.45517  ORF Transcript_25636/g.45517 Transcript_25636/m.45517 type:complete len:278 (-) Transcript_25636:144-977(-)
MPPPRRVRTLETREWKLCAEDSLEGAAWSLLVANAAVPGREHLEGVKDVGRIGGGAEKDADDAVWLMEHLRYWAEVLKFALACYMTGLEMSEWLHFNAIRVFADATLAVIESKLVIAREKERLSREQFNNLSMETARSKETVKISRKLRFLTTKTEPFVKTLDQKREERQLALEDLEKVVVLRNSLEDHRKSLIALLKQADQKVEDRDYSEVLNLVNDGSLQGCLSRKMTEDIVEILRGLSYQQALRRVAVKKLRQVRGSCAIIEQRLAELVATVWK